MLLNISCHTFSSRLSVSLIVSQMLSCFIFARFFVLTLCISQSLTKFVLLGTLCLTPSFVLLQL